MLEVIAAFELRFGDGTHLCRMREGPAKQPCGYTPVQVAAAFLDARNLPCNFLPLLQRFVKIHKPRTEHTNPFKL